MSNKPRYQEPRVGITIRLAKKDVMAKGDHFSQEQWEALKSCGQISPRRHSCSWP